LPRKHGANQISANTGLHRAMLITHIDTRLLQPGLAQLAGLAPPRPTVLRTATRNYQQALERFTQEIRFAA
jgi:hypothetical protein